ncbi:MAG TPA: extracellular solute-binding protein [Rugosimonospora sp.]|nr:extracellular solute-binding protein [Rugosimonospora sp.]
MRNEHPGRPCRRAAVAAVALAVLAGVAGCGSGSSGGGTGTAGSPVTIRFVWWGNDDRAKATKDAVALFAQRNPTIKVQTEFSAYDAYYQKLSTQIAGGAAPDLLQIDRPNLGEYAGRHALLNLGQYLGTTVHTDQIAPDLLAGGKVNGNQYAIPGGQLTQMLVYDPARFTKAGVRVPAPGTWTWAAFADAMAKVDTADGVPGTTDFGWAIDWFEVWLHQQGKALYTDGGKLGFTQADLTAFWTMTADMRSRKAVSVPQATTKMDGSMANSALVTKQAASEINYDSSLTAYLTSYGSPLQATAVPSDGSTSGMAAMPSVGFAVAQASAHKDAAVKLLDFLTNDPDAGKLLGATRGLPPNLQIRATVCGASTGNSRAVCDYEQSVKAQIGPAFGAWPKGSATIKRDFQTVYDDVIFGKASVAGGAKRVIDDANGTLSQ